MRERRHRQNIFAGRELIIESLRVMSMKSSLLLTAGAAAAFFLVIGSAAAAPELYVRADARPPQSNPEQTATAGPIALESRSGANVTGGNSHGKATAGFGFLHVVGQVTADGSATNESSFAAGGTARFKDTVTITAPGREGTAGRAVFLFRTFGRIAATGESGAQAQVTGSRIPSYTVQSSGRRVDDNFLGEQPFITYEFTFGVPFTVQLEITASSSTSTGSARAAVAEIGLSWQGVLRISPVGQSAGINDYTVAAESGANYAQPITSFTTGAVPDQSDLIVSSTGTSNTIGDGEIITYRTTVRNAGPATASGIQGSVLFRDGGVVSTTLPQGSYDRLGTALNINLPDLASGAETSFEVAYRADQPPPGKAQRVTLESSFFGNGIDLNRADNSVIVATGFSTPAPPIPPYYLERISPPSDYMPASGTFEAGGINAQGYVAITFEASSDANARRTPLIYTGSGNAFVELTWPGHLTPRAGEQPFVESISDTAPNGSYWVCGSYTRSDGWTRAVAWQVGADGRSTIYDLKNLTGENGAEFNEGSATAINSAGEAIGHTRSSGAFPVYWRLPNVIPQRLESGSIGLGIEKDIQEDGYAVGTGEDRSFSNSHGAYLIDVRGNRPPMRLPHVLGRNITPEVINANGVVGAYNFKDDDGPDGPFVYNLGDPALTRLPRPTGTIGDVSVEASGDAAVDINASGDIFGFASNPISLGNLHNPGGAVLWKRRANGSYRVYTLKSLWEQSVSSSDFIFVYSDASGIAADGTLLLKGTYKRVPGVFLLRSGDPRPKVTSALKVTGTVNQPFSYQIKATNNPTGFHAQSLPQGLQLDPNTGVISGTVTSAGEYSAAIWATNGAGLVEQKAFITFTFVDPAAVPVVTITSPANGSSFAAGTAFEFAATASSPSTSIETLLLIDNGVPIAEHDDEQAESVLSGLSPGQHVLTATARNSLGQIGSSSVTILVTSPNSRSFTFSGNGHWSNPGNWSPQDVPGENDTVVLGQSSITLSQPVTVRSLTLNGTTISGPGELTVTDSFSFVAGSLRNLTLYVEANGSFALSGDGAKTFENVAINNYGTTIASGAGAISGDPGTVFTNYGLLTFGLQDLQRTHATFGKLNNHRTVELNGGSIETTGEYVQAAGETDLGCNPFGIPRGGIGQISALVLYLLQGSLTGFGEIDSDLISVLSDLQVYIAPGCSPGLIEITGDYVQTANTTLVLEVAGPSAESFQYDQLKVGGQATFGGNLIVRTTNDYSPSAQTGFTPITYASASGDFANISSNVDVTFSANGVALGISGANPPAPKALNISTRMRVETGDNALIAGFIVTGNAPKRVLIRGIGPSLPVSGALADPILSLDNGAVTNDNWQSTQEQEIRDTTIPPVSDLESAIVATLNPGPHTAILRGKGDRTGVGLVEVYDLESGTPVQLANISTRGQVQAGDNVMIGGFIIGGDYPAKVLLRAIGPSLPVNGKLENPTLELVDANGGRITNDDWRATQEAEIIATTVPPTNDKEAAIVATLVPGFYTAIVRGKDGTVGVALVEGYNLQ